MKKIDFHNHPGMGGATCEQVVEKMSASGIDKICLLSVEGTAMDNGRSRDFPFCKCTEYYEKYPDKFVLGYCPDPRVPGAIEQLDEAVKQYGIKICGEIKFRMMYDNVDAIDLYRYCGERGLPVILHFDLASANPMAPENPRPHIWHGGDIDTLERILKLCPETVFFGHAPGFWVHISNDDKGLYNAYPTDELVRGGRVEQLLEKYSNLYCDCSAGSCLVALKRSPEYTKELMMKYPERFVFGRDNYGDDLSEFIDSLGLPEKNLSMFYHENAERLVGVC